VTYRGDEIPRRSVPNQHGNAAFKDKQRDVVVQDGRATVDFLLGLDLLATAENGPAHLWRDDLD
jgi:hypothetical protein